MIITSWHDSESIDKFSVSGFLVYLAPFTTFSVGVSLDIEVWTLGCLAGCSIFYGGGKGL